MSLKKQFLTSSLWTVSAAAFNNLSSLLVFVVLARLLTPEEFGTVAFAIAIVMLTKVLVTAGIPDALIRREQWDDGLASTAFWASVMLGSGVALAICAGIAPVLYFYYSQEFALVLAALSLTLIIDGLTAVHIAQLRRDFLYKVIARRSIATNIVSGIAGITLALQGWGVWAMVVSQLVATASTSFILWFSTPFRPRLTFSLQHLSEIGKFSGGVLGSQVLNQAGTQVPALLIGALLGPAAIAQYRVGSRSLDLVISLVIAPIQSTAVSVLGRYSADRSGLAHAYVRLTQSCSLIACPILLGIAAIAPDFVPLAFGAQWQEASYVLVALCLIAGPVTLGYFEAPAMNSAGRSDLTFFNSLVGSIGNIIAAALGLFFGPVGVAAALSLRAHLTMPFALHLVKLATGVKPWRAVQSILPAYAGAVLMAGLVALLRMQLSGLEPLPRLLLCIASGALLYPAIMLVLFRGYVRNIAQEVMPVLPGSLGRLCARL